MTYCFDSYQQKKYMLILKGEYTTVESRYDGPPIGWTSKYYELFSKSRIFNNVFCLCFSLYKMDSFIMDFSLLWTFQQVSSPNWSLVIMNYCLFHSNRVLKAIPGRSHFPGKSPYVVTINWLMFCSAIS